MSAMRVDPSQVLQSQLAAPAARRAGSAEKGTFGATLAKASTSAGTATPTPATGVPGQNSAPDPAPVRRELRTPKGERYADVPNHRYDEIVAGPRNGMYINRSGNVRDGQAFVLVQRDGRNFHIYGSGKDRLVVEVRRHAPASPAPAPAAPQPAAPAPPAVPAAPAPAVAVPAS